MRSGRVASLLWLLAAVSRAGAKIMDEETVLVSEVEAVQGSGAAMPCDVAPPLPGDLVYLVIWYKEDQQSPIYSFDARGKTLKDGKHWADDKTLGGRAHFHVEDSPAKLTLAKIKDSDAGVYRCRVDFKKSPTRNTKVNLTVFIPPEKLIIQDDTGANIHHYLLGPYNEDSSVNITCIAIGGRPAPKVTWWQMNALLDDSYEVLTDGRVQNMLRLEKLTRKSLHAVLTCQATNNNLAAPKSVTLTIDLNLRPLRVQMIGDNKPLSADNTYEIGCEVVGARPPPVITWSKGSIPLRNTREMTSTDGNTTTSTLTFVPTIEDSGKILTCRATNQLIAGSSLEDGWQLNIYHVPIVTLELGSNLNASTIREGVDVYFECNIKSNPWVYKVSWRHNGKTLYNNATAGTIISNQSLVLQSVTRNRAGLYTCVGSNQEGDGESNPVYLDVKYSPVCQSGQQKVHGVARQEAARVLCELDANPPDVFFSWKFNNSAETVDIPVSHVTADRARSVATYVPMTELDYGSLLCWGRNELGAQKEPCVFHIIPAGKPDPPHNCSILNQTADSLLVECTEGFDGGLQQEFVMEVYDAATQALVANVTSRAPLFTATGLESGLGFDMAIFSSNVKGRSESVPLHAYTLKTAAKRTGPPGRPVPPEQCTIALQTMTTVRVACIPAPHSAPATYVLQAYDADTRHLVASATSQSAEMLEITDLVPGDHRSLVLSVRAVTAHATSDAVSIYTVLPQPQLRPATPTILHITPILGVVIGVVSALVLVAIIIVVVMRLRGRGGEDEKERDDGGLNGGSGCRVTANGDKSGSVPLNKDTDDSIDSMDEKNPDIIPQNNDTDFQDPDEKAFEKLNNAPNRIYSSLTSRIQPPNPGTYDNSNNVPKSNEEVTYAELLLPKQQLAGSGMYSSTSPLIQGHPMPIIRHQEPTVYAQIDVTKKVAPQEGCLTFQQPPASPHPASLPLLHHQHHMATYQPPLHLLQRTTRTHDEDLLHESSATAETPLMSQHRESTVPLHSISESGRDTTPGPRVTATRF